MFDLLRFGPDGWGDEIAAGAWLTIRLALATLPFGLVVGFWARFTAEDKVIDELKKKKLKEERKKLKEERKQEERSGRNNNRRR